MLKLVLFVLDEMERSKYSDRENLIAQFRKAKIQVEHIIYENESVFDNTIAVNNEIVLKKEVADALRKHLVEPQECLLITSSDTLIREALQCKMPCIGYAGTQLEFTKLHDAKFLITALDVSCFDYMIQTYQRLSGLPVIIKETERLILREVTEADIESILAIYQREEVQAFIKEATDSRESMIEILKAYIQQSYDFYGYGYWAICEKRTQQLIGCCGVRNSEGTDVAEVELGYFLHPEKWGKGYAFEAIEAVLTYLFDSLCFPRVAAVVDIRNIRSLKLIYAFGMKEQSEFQRNGRTLKDFLLTAEQFREHCSSL